MKKREKVLSKFMNKYNNFKKQGIAKVENKIKDLSLKIKKESLKFDELIKTREKFKEENNKYDEVYNSLIEVLKLRGLLFNIPNKNFKVREWDNLLIKKINGRYELINKNKEPLYLFEEKYSEVIEHIMTEYYYSVVVTRIDRRYIKVQLRITGDEIGLSH